MRNWTRSQIPESTDSSTFFKEILSTLVKDLQLKLSSYLNPSLEISRTLAEENPNHLRILLHNIGKGFQKNISATEKMIAQLKVDVCFLVETGLTSESKIEIIRTIGGEKYHVFNHPVGKPLSGEKAKGGLMILVKEELVFNESINFSYGLMSGQHSQSKYRPEKLQKLRKTLSDPNLSLKTERKLYHQDCFIDLCGVRFILLYRSYANAPIFKLSRDLKRMKENAPKNIVIMGDFNSTDRSSTRKIKEYLERLELTKEYFRLDSTNVIEVIESTFPTHQQRVDLPTSYRSQNTIDLIFDDQDDPVVEKIFVCPFLSSDVKKDHSAIFFVVNKRA
ncbi:unnamed protein product, partial [Mesorhabditis belari]|uniref:Endonuclease/exonuclease/phosphatase domain-containing protein n=1 Tax=Mesorhabditis belari TaxID=2138241 RepID=A0AAF3EZU5_9BILA